MKLRAVVNGNVIEADEDEAKALIAAGIYEAVEEKEASPTSVAPLTTGDLPPKQKRLK